MSRLFLFSLLVGLLRCPLGAFVLESFNSTATFKTDSVDSGSSGSGAKETGVDGNAFKFTYSLGSGSYAQFYKDYSYEDWAFEGGNTLRFRSKASGSAAQLEIKITDYDGSTTTSKSDKLDLKIPLQTDNQWRTYTVHFSSFTTFGDGNSSFNLNQVSRLAFAIVGLSSNTYDRGSGTVWLDKIELYKSHRTLVDDFNDGDEKNYLGSVNRAFHSATSTKASRQFTVVGGENVMEFVYDVTGSDEFAGAYLQSIVLGNNFQGYSHVSFKIRGKDGGEKLKLKLESTRNQAELFISTYLVGGITTTFQEVQMPLDDFTIDKSTISKITFLALKSINSGSGTVYIDDVALIRKNESSEALRTLEDAEGDFASTNWEDSQHDDASLTVQNVLDASAPGAQTGNRVFKLDYSFKTSGLRYPTETPYVIIEKPLFLNVAPYSKLNFRYKGTDSANNIEFKLTDSDDTTYVKKFAGITNTGGEWKTATIPLDQLAFFSSGTDADLNMKKIKKIWFAVTKNAGGSGTFSVDSLESSESGDIVTADASRLISSFKIVNNPFSPNGDKVKDECYFIYSLSSASKVSLKIHGLDGVERKTVFAGEQSVGEQSVAWDGTDSNGDKIANGLYLYRLEAEGADNRKDSVVQVIAVLK